MTAAVGERRLAQWMLDVGTPATQVFELLASTAGLAHGARIVSDLEVPTDAVSPVWQYQRLVDRRAS